jgi:hypothetical protein
VNVLEERKYKEFLEETGDDEKARTLYVRWKILTDLYFFATEVLGWKEVKKGTQNKIDPKFHRWFCNILEKDDGEDRLILVPRYHLKSTFIKLKIIQDVLRDPNTSILLGSRTTTLTKQELLWIRRVFATPILRRLFPDIIPDPGKDFNNWEKATETELTLCRPNADAFIEQGPQIYCAGMGTTITGFHPKKVYLDDIIDDSTISSLIENKKAHDWWVYLQPIAAEAPITITGTFYHYLDLYNTIIRNGSFGKNVHIRGCKENGKYIWSYMNDKRFNKMTKEMTPYAISSQMFNKPIPEEDKLFPEPQPLYKNLPPGKYKYYIAVDPAATDNPWSDDTGLVVGAVDEINNLWIVEATGIKKNPNAVADFIIQKYLQYKPLRIGIELGLQNSLQYLLEVKRQIYENTNKVRLPIVVVPVSVSRKKSKVQRISMTLGAFMREGRAKISENCKELLDQMHYFTGRESDKDDLIDAASMLFSTIETFSQFYWFQPQEMRQPAWGYSFQELFKPKIPEWDEKFVSGRV